MMTGIPMFQRVNAFVGVIIVCPAFLSAQTMRLVGQSNLGGGGLNGDIAIVGTTAIVGAGLMPAAGVHAHLYNPYPCKAVTIKVVDLSRPRTPVVVATIPVPAGVAAHGVAAARVRTAAFTGDLAAVALQTCGAGGSTVERGVVYYDITRPAAPQFLSRYQADADIVHADSIPPCGLPPAKSAARCASSQHSVSLVQRADGRVFSLSLEPGASAGKFASGDLRIVDVTDPRRPVQVGAFPPPGPREVGVHRTPRSRIFPPSDLSVFSSQRAAVRGDIAVVPWNSDGARVIDLASGGLREVGSFVPPDVADPAGVLPAKAYVVSVAILPPRGGNRRAGAQEYVVLSDVNSGLYVLEAPWGVTRLANQLSR